MREEKIREKQLRKLAAEQGLGMVKSGRHDPRALDDDGYVLVNVATNHVVAGPGAVGDRQGVRSHPHLSLDDVEAYLTGRRQGFANA